MPEERSFRGWLKRSKSAIRSRRHPAQDDPSLDASQPSQIPSRSGNLLPVPLPNQVTESPALVISRTVQSSPKDARNPRHLRELALEKLNKDECNVLLSRLDHDSDGTEDLIVVMDKAKALLYTEKLYEDNRNVVVKKTQLFLIRLDRFQDSGQALASIQSTTLGGVWAGINALIVIATKHKEQQEALVDALDTVLYVSRLLGVYYHWFCKLKPSPMSKTLSEDIVELYAQIYRISACAILAQSTGSVKRLWNALAGDSDFAGFKQRCDKLCERVQGRLRDCDHDETSEWRIGLQQQISGLENELKDDVKKVEDKINLVNLELVLSKLKVAGGATYKAGDSFCLNDTRVDILADIVQWAASLGNPKIFWLRGKAGTGKTTIARTVARKLDGEIVGGEKCIVASFFFKRGGGNLERIAYLVPTVARQLADTMSSLATGIANALREDSQLPGANMDYQFRYLLQAPCEAISQGRVNRTRIIIVIDSLDECDDAKGIETLLPLLGTLVKIHSTNLQVLVTSRPDRIIEDTFDTMDSTLCTRMDLDDAQEMSIGQDMRKFFIAEFAKIRGRPSVRRLANLGEDWPGETNIEALVQQSKPVFIVASTICRYIDTANPQGRLQDLFTQRSDNLTSRLEQLYLPILRHASIDADGQKNYHWEPLFESIVKPLILLNQPLSLRALAELLDCSPAEVREALDPLYSVIQVPIEDSKPITTYHLSFRDCLVNLHDKAQAQFRINEKETHRVLLERCLELLRSSFLQHGLSEGVVGGGICGPMCPGTSRKRISRDQIDSHISEAVRYAACNWCSHLIKLNPGLIELENVDEFLKRHFLHWIECMSWLGKIKDAISIVNQLRLHAVWDNRTHDFKAFLEDAIRWIAAFQDLVSTTPLQTYLAALVRSPSKSIVRARFNHLIEQNLDMCFSRHDDWGPLQQRIRYGDSVSCVAISPDNKTVAAGLYNGNVRLWDTDMNTDAELYWVKNGRSHIHELRFLPDGRNLSMSSLDCALIINMLTKEVKVLFDRSKDSSQICGISPDAQLAAVDSQGVITLHNLRTKTKQLDISKERRPGSPVVFSPDSGTVVSSLTDCSVKIWSTSSGDEVASLEEHSDDISCLAFSPNGSRLASGCESGTICLWNTSTWSQEWVFDGNTALQFTFSPEGETLALAGICEPFFLLNAETGEEEVSSEIDIDGCTAFALSSGGRKLVVGNEAGDLRVLDARIEPRFQTTMIGAEITAMVVLPDQSTVVVGTEEVPLQVRDMSNLLAEGRLLEGHADSVKVIKMSPDGQLLATGSHDASVRLWDTHNWKQISLMKGHTSTISTLAFTLNGDMIASGSEDCTVRIWNTKSGEQMSIFTGHVEKLITAAVSPVDDTVASSDATGDVRLWDAKGGNQKSVSLRGNAVEICEQYLELFADPFFKVMDNVFSSDGRTIATVSRCMLGKPDQAVRVWDAEFGKLQLIILGLKVITMLRFSPQGKAIISGYWNRTVWTWVETGTQGFELYWPIGQPVELMPLIGNPPKNLTDQGQPQTQLYKARYPKTPMEKPLLDPLTHHPWSSEADWIQYKGCDLIRLPYQYAAEEVISAGNGVIRFRHLNHFYVTLFKREWLDKVEQLQQHCRCPEDWIRKSGFRPRLGVGYSGLEEHTGDELENDLDDPGLLWWGKDDPPLADAY